MTKYRALLPAWWTDIEAASEAEAEAIAIERLCKELRENRAGLLVNEELPHEG